MKKLSVITINKDNAVGLQKTMLSVIQQDFEDLEFIIVDGESKDESVQVIQDIIANQNPNNFFIKYISEKDTGIYNAMNKGIKMATGEYCHFLNSGDYLAFKETYSTLFSYNLSEDIIYGNQIDVYSDKQILNKGYAKSDISFFDVFNGALFHSSSFSKRSLFEKYGFFDESYNIISDYIFFVKAIGYGDATVRYIDMLISYFDGNGVSSQQGGEIAKLHIEEDQRAYKELFSPRLLDLCKKEQKKVIAHDFWTKYPVIWFFIKCLHQTIRIYEKLKRK